MGFKRDLNKVTIENVEEIQQESTRRGLTSYTEGEFEKDGDTNSESSGVRLRETPNVVDSGNHSENSIQVSKREEKIRLNRMKI